MATSKKNTIYTYLKLLLLKSYPISHAYKEELRSHSKYGVNIWKNNFNGTILHLVEIFSQSSKQEVPSTRAAIIFDGSTNYRVHYLLVFM